MKSAEGIALVLSTNSQDRSQISGLNFFKEENDYDFDICSFSLNCTLRKYYPPSTHTHTHTETTSSKNLSNKFIQMVNLISPRRDIEEHL